MPEEKHLVGDVPAEHFRSEEYPDEPFHADLLPKDSRTLAVSGIPVEHVPDGGNHVHVQILFVLYGPFLLFGRGHPHEQHIRLEGVDRLVHFPVVLFGKFRPERWGV